MTCAPRQAAAEQPSLAPALHGAPDGADVEMRPFQLRVFQQKTRRLETGTPAFVRRGTRSWRTPDTLRRRTFKMTSPRGQGGDARQFRACKNLTKPYKTVPVDLKNSRRRARRQLDLTRLC